MVPRLRPAIQNNADSIENATETIKLLIKQENKRLRAEGIRLSIERKGLWLHLRGNFPPKPYSGRAAAHQQPLALGLWVSEETLKQAKKNIKQAAREAKKIWLQLLSNTFQWEEYARHKKRQNDFLKKQKEIEEQSKEKLTYRDLLNMFEKHFYENSLSQKKDRRWKALKAELKFLDTDEEFSEEGLEEKILDCINGKRANSTKEKVRVMITQFLNFLKGVLKE